MTQEEILEMAKQAGFERLGHDDCDYVCYPDEIEAFAKLIAEKERKACANIAEEGLIGHTIAKAIRAREQA